MKTFEPILTTPQTKTEQLQAQTTSKLNKVDSTSIYKDLKLNLLKFRTMYKTMDNFSKVFIGSKVIDTLIYTSSEFLCGYSAFTKEDKLKYLKSAQSGLVQIRNFLKIGYELNSFIERDYIEFMDRIIKTQTALNQFVASQSKTE